jgi:hypothetical protein
MLLAEGAPDRMQRLFRLPTPPHVALLRGRKSKPFPWVINTTFEISLIPDGVASTG